MVANRLGSSGPSWAQAFGLHNSGTYNNEWHLVDYNVFDASRKSGVVLLPNLLTIVDQMPGNIEVADATGTLKAAGYWASYNRPGLPGTWALANYTETVEAYGDHYSHAKAARAQLFQRLQGSIVDETSLKKVMRFNRFDDPALPRAITNQMCGSGPSASNAISERGDLTPTASNCAADVAQQDEGGIDMKYTSAELMLGSSSGGGGGGGYGLRAVAQSGPTYDDQPVFVWSASPFANNTAHAGQPDRWEFPYVTVGWSSMVGHS